VSRTSALTEIITPDSGALADNDPAAIARAVGTIISRPEYDRRSCARRRAEMFTWQQAAAGMLTTLSAADPPRRPRDSQATA
jgi:alpha-1,6-mannosyltransferase